MILNVINKLIQLITTFLINATYFNKKRCEIIITRLIAFINILLLLFQS